MKLTHQEASRECPKFKHAPPFIRVKSDIIVHLHWNALQQTSGKEMRVGDWIIITMLHSFSTGGHTSACLSPSHLKISVLSYMIPVLES